MKSGQRKMSIAVIALIYGVEAIKIKQDPAPVPWAQRSVAPDVLPQANNEVSNWSYRDGNAHPAPKALAQGEPQEPAAVPWSPRSVADDVKPQAAKEVSNWSYRDGKVHPPVTALAQGEPQEPAAIPWVQRVIDPEAQAQANKEVDNWSYRDGKNHLNPLALSQGKPAAAEVDPYALKAVPWSPRSMTPNYPVHHEGDSGVVSAQAAKEVANWSYSSSKKAPVVVAPTSLVQGEPQAPAPVPWKPRDHAANQPVQAGGDVAAVKLQAAGEVANWAYRSLVQGEPQAPAPVPWKPRDHKSNIPVKKGGDIGPVSQQAANEVANWSYRSLSQIDPQHPTGLVPQRKDQQYDGIQQLKKPLNFENATEHDDFKDIFNPNKQPDPGAYSQMTEPNPVPINGSSDYEKYNNANLSGRPSEVLKQNQAADVRTMSNRWEGNPEYKSSYDYTPRNNAFETNSIKPKYLNAQMDDNPEYKSSYNYKPGNNNFAIDSPKPKFQYLKAAQMDDNPEYKSSYNYKPGNNNFAIESPKPKFQYLKAAQMDDNPEYKSSYDYKPGNNNFAIESPKPKFQYLKAAQLDEPFKSQSYDNFNSNAKRAASYRNEGNPDYKSSYDYTPGNNNFAIASPKPKFQYTNAAQMDDNPDYKSSYDYKPGNNNFAIDSPKPKFQYLK